MSARRRTSVNGSSPIPSDQLRPHRAHDRRDRGAGVRFDRDQSLCCQSDRTACACFDVCCATDNRFYILITADHWAPQVSSTAAGAAGDAEPAAPFASVWAVDTAHVHGPAARVFCCAPAPMDFSRAAPGRACSRSNDAPGPARARSISPESASCVREANAFLSGKSQAVRDCCRPRWRKPRPRSTSSAPPSTATGSRALSAAQSTAGHQSPQRRGGRRVRHPSGGRLQRHRRCSSSAPGRTGATAPIFPRPTGRSRPGEVLGAFLAQFYDDKPCPRCIFCCRMESRSANCWPRRSSTKSRPQGRSLRAAARREEGPGRRTRWSMPARRWAGSWPRPRRSRSCSECLPTPSACRACRGASRSTTTATSRDRMQSAP